MGPFIVLIFWAIIAAVLSLIGGGILAALAASLTRGVTTGRKRAITIAGLLPAAGFAYLFVCVILFALWSDSRGRDMGWGDTWDTPILGHYNLLMIDVTDKATIYNRDDRSVSDGHGSVFGSPNQRDVVFGVRRLQVRAPYILAAASPEHEMDEPITAPETLFFTLDTRSNVRVDYKTLDQLKAAALQLNIPLKLEPVDDIYSRYRYTWADLIPLLAFALLPLLIGAILLRSFMRLRSTRIQSDLSASITNH